MVFEPTRSIVDKRSCAITSNGNSRQRLLFVATLADEGNFPGGRLPERKINYRCVQLPDSRRIFQNVIYSTCSQRY